MQQNDGGYRRYMCISVIYYLVNGYCSDASCWWCLTFAPSPNFKTVPGPIYGRAAQPSANRRHWTARAASVAALRVRPEPARRRARQAAARPTCGRSVPCQRRPYLADTPPSRSERLPGSLGVRASTSWREWLCFRVLYYCVIFIMKRGVDTRWYRLSDGKVGGVYLVQGSAGY